MIRPPATFSLASLVWPLRAIVFRTSNASTPITTPIAIFHRRFMAGVTLAQQMDKFVIQGAAPPSGRPLAAGNKTAALPILAACLLTEEELAVRNVPRIRDVESMLALLE